MTTLDILLRLSIASACGSILGLHVELRQRPGGIRPHIMTALGAALFCITAQNMADDKAGALRALQGVASGVGFIGGSVVLRRGASVQGLATGASLWISAAIGCAVSVGDWGPALAVAVFVAVVNAGALYLERAVSKFDLNEPPPDPDPP